MLTCICPHKWMIKQKKAIGREILKCFGDSRAVSQWQQGGKGPLLLWGEWKPSRSQIPSYQRGHSGSNLISFFWVLLKDSLVLLCQIKVITPFCVPLWPLLRQQLTDLLLALCQAGECGLWSVVRCDKAPVMTGHLWEETLFLCIHSSGAGVVVNRRSEHRTNIMARPLASLPALPLPLAGCLRSSTHSFHSSVSVHLSTKFEFGWKPLQWLVTTAVTLRHTRHSSGQSFCRQLRNHSVFLQSAPKMYHCMVFVKAVWFCSL